MQKQIIKDAVKFDGKEFNKVKACIRVLNKNNFQTLSIECNGVMYIIPFTKEVIKELNIKVV